MSLDAVIQLHMGGDLEGAERGYRRIISENASQEVAYANLAMICARSGRDHEAIELLQASLKLNPLAPGTYLNFGVVLEQLGYRAGALSCYQMAVHLRPDYAEARNNTGLVLQAMGRLDAAVASYQKALEIKPSYPAACFNLANAFHEQGRLQDAISMYRQALALKPDYVAAYLNLGVALSDTAYADSQRERLEEAIGCYRKALEINPRFGKAYNNLGLCLQQQGKLHDAIAAYRRALELDPDSVEAHDNLGNALRDCGHLDDAIASHQRALALRAGRLQPSSLAPRIAHLLLELLRIPIIYGDSGEVEHYRQSYAACLMELESFVVQAGNTFTADEAAILRTALFKITNFYVAYQQRNDKDLQIAYSRLAMDILRSDLSPYLEARSAPRPGSKIRVGIASEFLRYHNGAFWAYNWLANLPADDYQFFLYSLQGMTDEFTQKFAALGTYRWLPFREDTYLQSLKVMKEDNLDVLLLPDVGMGPASRILSLVRLAPIQCVGWGHPVTTGSPNIDYYLSSELMETEQSQSHYSEQLIGLPNLGFNFDDLSEPQAAARCDFELPEDRTIYGSLQSLFKYLPQHDSVYPLIAKAVPDALFVFVASDSDHVTAAFRERLRKSFQQADVSFTKHVKILPRMQLSRFTQLLSVVDACLDSIGWSGGITTLRTLAMDRPVVTWPGEFMRGRHSYAMLKVIGLDELIAKSVDEYIEIACKMGLDVQWRLYLAKKIKAHKHKLFNDNDCVEFLDKFLKTQVAK